MIDSHFFALVIPAFIAGVLTFFAPCTLPLVPGFLGFISGASHKNITTHASRPLRKKIFYNGVFYVLGFSFVFMLLGSVFGAAGSLLGAYRIWLSRIGGVFVIFFGLYLMHVFHLKFFNFLQVEKKFHLAHKLTPGKASSSFLFGMTFAFGWTPCVGPILGTILLLASTSGTLLQGTLLLFIFSLGLSIPFLLLALAIGHATAYVQTLTKYLHIISIVGGVFLLVLGVLLVTDQFAVWIGYFYDVFGFINYTRLLDYL